MAKTKKKNMKLNPLIIALKILAFVVVIVWMLINYQIIGFSGGFQTRSLDNFDDASASEIFDELTDIQSVSYVEKISDGDTVYAMYFYSSSKIYSAGEMSELSFAAFNLALKLVGDGAEQHTQLPIVLFIGMFGICVAFTVLVPNKKKK